MPKDWFFLRGIRGFYLCAPGDVLCYYLPKLSTWCRNWVENIGKLILAST